MSTIAFLLWTGAVLLQGQQAEEPPVLRYDEVARAALPGAAALAVEAELAELRRVLATSSRGLLDEPVLQVTGGPRIGENDEGDDTRGDVELELELPWRRRSTARRRLEGLGVEAASVLEAAGRASAALELRRAYIDAWRAQELLSLRERAAQTTRRLVEVARSRAAAGADPAYEAQLAALEAEGAATAVAAAAAELAAAWHRLGAVSQVGTRPPTLAAPAFATATTSASFLDACRDEEADPQPSRQVAQRAVELRAELEIARAALELDADLSRLSWIGSVAREGREDVARVGVSLSLPRTGVPASRREAAATHAALLRRQAELQLADLAARRASAQALLRSQPVAPAGEGAPSSGDDPFAAPLAAIEARLGAGRASPAESLALRRGLLALQEESLERAARREQAAAELIALCAPVEVEEVTP